MTKLIQEGVINHANVTTTADEFILPASSNLLRFRLVGQLCCATSGIVTGGQPIDANGTLFGVTINPAGTQPPFPTLTNCNGSNYTIWAGPPKIIAQHINLTYNWATSQFTRSSYYSVDIETDLEYSTPDNTHAIWVLTNFTNASFLGETAQMYYQVHYELWQQ